MLRELTIQSVIPNSLRLFLDELRTKEPGKSAIAHDIIASVTNKITPKQVLLGTAVRYLTGSKQVIEQLNKLGHSRSYMKLLRLDQVLEQTLNRDSKTSGGIISIINHKEARTKWFLTSHIRAQMLSLQKDFC